MTRYIGIDETIVELGPKRNLFIYVACTSGCDFYGEEKEGKFPKKRVTEKRRITENKFKLDIDGLDGFVFRAVLLGSPDESRDQALRRRQADIIYGLAKQVLDLSIDQGSLDGEKRVQIQIDGSDNYHISEELVLKLEKAGYGLQTDVHFIPKGDTKVRIINLADTFAYLLRGLNLREMSPQDLAELEKLYDEATPRVRKILPYHLQFKGRDLEKRVA